MINLDQIKTGGARISLEAELTTQASWIKNYTPKDGYSKALDAARNCVAILEELNKISPPINEPEPTRPSPSPAQAG